MLPALLAAAPVFTDAAKIYYGQLNANRDRTLTREQMAQQEKDRSFQRLLALSNQSQGMQNQLSGAQRLFSLRNAGGSQI